MFVEFVSDKLLDYKITSPSEFSLEFFFVILQFFLALTPIDNRAIL